MPQNVHLDYGDPAIEAFFDATQEVIGTIAPGFVLDLANPTTLRLRAGDNNAQKSLAIEGRYRYVREDILRAHPGGPAGTYVVWATAQDNRFNGVGADLDQTDYRFSLAITAASRPTGVELARDVATCEWDGQRVTAIDHRVGPASGVARHRSTHAIGGTDPLSPADIGAAPLAAAFPIGGVLDWPAAVDPPGPAVWLELLGQPITRAAYPALFEAWGLAGNTANLQNRTGRFAIGAGATPAGSGRTGRAVNETGGEQEVTLLERHLASHTHAASQAEHSHGPEWADSNFLAQSGGGPTLIPQGLPTRGDIAPAGLTTTRTDRQRPAVTVSPAGQNSPHNNLPPFIGTRYFVRAA